MTLLTIVDACVRDGAGGSPTAVVDDDPSLSDDVRRTVPVRSGTSHAAFLGRACVSDGGRVVRFFTAEGELTGCGHGTVAAQAVLLHRSSADARRGRQHTGGRTFEVKADRRADGIEVWFDQGAVEVSRPSTQDRLAVLDALGQPRVDGDVVVASPGTPRFLVPVADRETLFGLTPDLDRLARLPGVLGCFVYAVTGTGTAVARMFAPAIGVPEDIANANSTGCLAAHLNAEWLRVDQGDRRGCPSTVLAACHRGRVSVGGVAVLR
jgi:trans-2,3-dihydro-3-hydroxyanthranilate isomerase